MPNRPDAGRRFGKAAARVERWHAEAEHARAQFEAALDRGAAPRWVEYWARRVDKAERLATRAEDDRDAWAHRVTTELHARRRDVLRKREQRHGKLSPDDREEQQRLTREAERRKVRRKVTGKAIELVVRYRTRRGWSNVDFTIRLARDDGARLTLDEGRAALEQWVRHGELPEGYAVDGVNWIRPGKGGRRYGDASDAESFHGIMRAMGLARLAEGVHFPSGDIRVALVEEAA